MRWFPAFTALAVALGFTLGAEQAGAQAHPDFSGSWTLAEIQEGPGGADRQGDRYGMREMRDGAAGMGGMRRGGGMATMGGLGRGAMIEQDGETFAVVRVTPLGEVRSVYRLDGAESRNRVGGSGGEPMELVSRASWEGEALVIVTPVPLGGTTAEFHTTFRLDEAGRLVVEASSTGRMGAGDMRAVYTRD